MVEEVAGSRGGGATGRRGRRGGGAVGRQVVGRRRRAEVATGRGPVGRRGGGATGRRRVVGAAARV